jgi:glycosyltransferase involved in cell wall biosynthesis
MIAVNCAFEGQQVTGQQRYALEIVAQLAEIPGVRRLVPPDGASRAASWAWAQTLGLRTRREESLLTLTSRGPIVSPRHVVTVHDTFVLTNPEWFSRKYVASHAPILRLQLAGASGIVAVSETTALSVRELVGMSRPVVVAPNAPAEIFFRADVNEVNPFPQVAALSRGQFIVAVASHDPRKNLQRLVTAYELLPLEVRTEHPLVLVGGGGDTFRLSDRERHAIARYSIGYVSDSQLRWLYANAAVVAFPSLNEGFGLPVVEALAAGASIAVSDIPIMHWVAGPYADYFDPLDVNSIAESLVCAVEMQNPSDNRVQWVRERFSWKTSAKKIVDFVNEGI